MNVKGGVNKGIRGTILNERNKFFTYNNGISTTAKSIECKNIPGLGKCIVKFNDLQIINGGQTTASLASARIKDGAALDHIYVQMKLTIVKSDDPEFVRNISKYSDMWLIFSSIVRCSTIFLFCSSSPSFDFTTA